MRIDEFVKLAGQASKNKGFRDKPVDTATRLMLIVSELSEALEADRRNRHANIAAFLNDVDNADYDTLTPEQFSEKWNMHFRGHIKDTFEDEIADAAIRIADLCELMNIDLTKHIMLKMEYNSMRPHKHGKEY